MEQFSVIALPAFKNRSINPYNWLLYSHMENEAAQVDEFSVGRLISRQYMVWHIHWPDTPFTRPQPTKMLLDAAGLIFLLCIAKIKGIKIVWTVHNLRAHERFYPLIENWFWRIFMRFLDGYISLSETGQRSALEHFPKLQQILGFVIPHGHYRDVYPDHATQEEARFQLGISPTARVITFVGHIRPYKNVPQLVRTFRNIADPEAVLLIAGKPGLPELAREIEIAASEDQRVKFFLEHIPENDMQLYLRAANLVILPYADILNSGSALLALSFDRPVLIPRRGSMGELQAFAGEEWVKTYIGELTPEKIQEALEWSLNSTRPEQAPLEKLDWSNLAYMTLAAYKEICMHEGDVKPDYQTRKIS